MGRLDGKVALITGGASGMCRVACELFAAEGIGLLAVELAVSMTSQQGPMMTRILAAAFFLVSVFFVRRSFYGMRIG